MPEDESSETTAREAKSGFVDLRALLQSGERAIAWLREHIFLVPSLAALLGIYLYAGALRYYDGVFREVGVPGLPVRVDQGQTLARAAVGGIIVVSFVLMAFFAYETTRVSFLERSLRIVPFVIFVATPVIVGVGWGAGPQGVSIGLDLIAWGVIDLIAYLCGARVGLRARRTARHMPDGEEGHVGGNEPHVPAEAAVPLGERTPPPAITRRLSVGWVPFAVSIVLVSIWAQVDRYARDDATAIRKGGRQGDITALFAPLDVRKVLVSWKEPSVIGRIQLPLEPVLLLSHADGRVIAVGDKGRLLDLPAADVVVTSP